MRTAITTIALLSVTLGTSAVLADLQPAAGDDLIELEGKVNKVFDLGNFSVVTEPGTSLVTVCGHTGPESRPAKRSVRAKLSPKLKKAGVKVVVGTEVVVRSRCSDLKTGLIIRVLKKD
jgi:translation initiation factor IF-1